MSWRETWPLPGAEDATQGGMSQLAAYDAGLTDDPGCWVQPIKVYWTPLLDPGSPEYDPEFAAEVAWEERGAPGNPRCRLNRPHRTPSPAKTLTAAPNLTWKPNHDRALEPSMALTILDTTMTSDHSARHVPDRNGWEVSWLPGQILNRNSAVTAMVLADTAAGSDVHESHRLWPHIQNWAAPHPKRSPRPPSRPATSSASRNQPVGLRATRQPIAQPDTASEQQDPHPRGRTVRPAAPCPKAPAVGAIARP